MIAARAWLRSVAIRDFRNLERVDVEIPAAGVAIIGANGQGKTNFLEAVYYLQILRSFRSARDPDLVRFGCAGFHLAATADGLQPTQLAAGYETAGKRKKVVHDGLVIGRLSEAFGALPSVVFSPRDLELIAGAPAERRRFLDVLLALTSRRYLVALQLYRQALTRRNAALRVSSRTPGDEDPVAVWEPLLAEHGAFIIQARREWLRTSADSFASLCTAIGEEDPASISYRSTAGDADDPQSALRSALERQRRQDMVRGMTHAGPHRDDLEFRLGNRELRTFGSAGQQRTAAIALRMLEAASLRDASGVEPILLLDDPFAELDIRRGGRILELLRDRGIGQVLIAVPRKTEIPHDLLRLDRWSIQRGVISAA